MLKWAVLLIIVMSTYAQAGLQFKFRQEDPELFKNAVIESIKLLPENYFDAVEGVVNFEVATLEGDEDISENLCNVGDKAIFGMKVNGLNPFKSKRERTIVISAKMFDYSLNNQMSYFCQGISSSYRAEHHGNYQTLFKAVVIHELTHVKDNVEHISTEAEFQRIVGMKKIQSSGKKHLMNFNVSGSPDAYEFENLEESLAINTEYLVLDSDYECRRPSTAKFLSQRLGIPLKGTCQKSFKIPLQSSFPEDNYLSLANLDPSRIYQIHYLFAGKGQEAMSRFGHAMFRVIVCSPNRDIIGPDCLKDVSHHLVLSYRANMTELNVSYSKGMFGYYPSQLFIMRFHEVQQEYTKFDFRDLYSIPLKLNQQQKSDFIDITLERFWAYQGKYYFFDNNCGSETLKQLGVVLPEDQSKLIHSITPLKMYNDIISKNNNLTDGNLDGLDRNTLIVKGILIESMFDSFNSNYQELVILGLFKEKDFKVFSSESKAEDRFYIYQNYLPKLDLDVAGKRSVILKILFLERYLANQFSRDLPKKVLKLMRKDHALKNEVEKLGESLKDLNTQPWEVISSSYGVPLNSEFELQWPSFTSLRKSKLEISTQDQITNLQSILGRSLFIKELNEVEYFKKINKITSEYLLKVNTEKEIL